jgi:hypothetical protein
MFWPFGRWVALWEARQCDKGRCDHDFSLALVPLPVLADHAPPLLLLGRRFEQAFTLTGPPQDPNRCALSDFYPGLIISLRGLIPCWVKKGNFIPERPSSCWICRFHVTPTSPGPTPCLRFESIEHVNEEKEKGKSENGIPVGSRLIKERGCGDQNGPFENSNARRLDARRAGDAHLSPNDFRQSHGSDRAFELHGLQVGWRVALTVLRSIGPFLTGNDPVLLIEEHAFRTFIRRVNRSFTLLKFGQSD